LLQIIAIQKKHFIPTGFMLAEVSGSSDLPFLRGIQHITPKGVRRTYYSVYRHAVPRGQFNISSPWGRKHFTLKGFMLAEVSGSSDLPFLRGIQHITPKGVRRRCCSVYRHAVPRGQFNILSPRGQNISPLKGFRTVVWRISINISSLRDVQHVISTGQRQRRRIMFSIMNVRDETSHPTSRKAKSNVQHNEGAPIKWIFVF
jgi:hypothetical protein